MEIVRIFETPNQGLFSIKYEKNQTDEFDRLFDSWQDVEYLEKFFNNNKNDLTSGFFGSISIEDAVMQTINDAKELQKQLLEIKDSNELHPIFLNSYFKPLDNLRYKPDDLERYKAYGVINKSWIRLYAIRVPNDFFVVTGGTIKLTRAMRERTHTQTELDRLNSCRDFLRSQGIFDEDGLKD